MVMGHRKVNPKFRCENNTILNSDALQMLGATVDDMLKSPISVEKYGITVHKPGISTEIGFRLKSQRK